MKRLLDFILNFQKKRALKRQKSKELTPEESAENRVISGDAWNEFCDSLRAAGNAVLGFESPEDPFTRAEGFRYLSRIIRAGLENYVESGYKEAPELKRLVHETIKIGHDSPDYFYYNCPIEGKLKYKITGTLGTTPFIIFSTQEDDYTSSKDAEMPLSGQLTTEEMVIGPYGEVEIILSNEKEGKNWLRTTPQTKMVMIREVSGDIKKEVLSKLKIELISDSQKAPVLTALHLDNGLARTSKLVRGASLLFARWSRDFRKTTNQLPEFDRERSITYGGDPNTVYYRSYWKLNQGKAIVIEVKPPECVSWNFVLANHWLESLDYRYSQIHVNKHTALYRPDGSVRIIISKENPGLPNWLDPQGHEFGGMCFRWNRAVSHPDPLIKEVSLGDLSEYIKEEEISPSKKMAYVPRQPSGKPADYI